MTFAGAVARVTNSLKLLNKDSRISRRFVLRVIRDILTTYTSQRMGERSLGNDYNLYSQIDCFEFEREDVVNCPIVEFRRCNILMKSKKPLPKLIYSRLGSSLKTVTSIDDNNEFLIVDRQQYRRNQKRKYNLNETQVFLDENGYLYIPDKEILSVNPMFLTLETEKIDELCGCKEKPCKSGWEYELKIADKLIEPVFSQALQIVAATYGATIADSNPNGIDKQPTQ